MQEFTCNNSYSTGRFTSKQCTMLFDHWPEPHSWETDTQKFDLGDILSVTTGVLVSRTKIDGVQKLLSFMFGTDLFTHELVIAGDYCKRILLTEFSSLASVEVPKWDFKDMKDSDIQSTVYTWLDSLVEEHGQYRLVRKATENEKEDYAKEQTLYLESIFKG